jgi:hypothetical protein
MKNSEFIFLDVCRSLFHCNPNTCWFIFLGQVLVDSFLFKQVLVDSLTSAFRPFISLLFLTYGIIIL